MCWMAKLWCGEKIDPSQLNPYRREKVVKRERTPEQLARESPLAWKCLDDYFHQGRRQ